jgi:hypothetical protein
MKELTKIQKIYRDLSEPNEVGEDGDMVCRATTEKGALLKFKRWVRENAGLWEDEGMKIDDISTCFLFEADDEFREKNKDNSDALECEWYVSTAKKNKMPLFKYNY